MPQVEVEEIQSGRQIETGAKKLASTKARKTPLNATCRKKCLFFTKKLLVRCK